MLKVGIIAAFKQESIDKINRVAFDYVTAVEETGVAIPFIVPCNIKNIDKYINELDVFIIPGGDDIDPSVYNQSVDGSYDFVKKNDEFLLKFIEKIEKTNKLLIGICKGHQLINIYYGGNLIQDIPEKKHHYQYEKQEEVVHDVFLEGESILKDAYGGNIVPVNSIHHQVIDDLGDNLKIIGKSKELYIEAIQHTSKNIIGVQWHPESIETGKVFFTTLFSKYLKNGKI